MRCKRQLLLYEARLSNAMNGLIEAVASEKLNPCHLERVRSRGAREDESKDPDRANVTTAAKGILTSPVSILCLEPASPTRVRFCAWWHWGDPITDSLPRSYREQRLAILYRLAVGDQALDQLAGHVRLDFIHQLHGLDDAQSLSYLDRIANLHKWRGTG